MNPNASVFIGGKLSTGIGVGEFVESKETPVPTSSKYSVEEIQALVLLDGLPRCLKCGMPMRHNVPRLGPDGGFVHAASGSLECNMSEPKQTIKAQVLQTILCPGCGGAMSNTDDLKFIFCREVKCTSYGGKAFYRPHASVDLIPKE